MLKCPMCGAETRFVWRTFDCATKKPIVTPAECSDCHPERLSIDTLSEDGEDAKEVAIVAAAAEPAP